MKGFNSLTRVFLFLVVYLVVFPIPGLGINDESGFITLDPVDFSISPRFIQGYFPLHFRSSQAKIWYVFQRADHNPEEKPLFVFFNGGPGSATSCGLLVMNTGRRAMAEEGDDLRVGPNPHSWTRLGNLLYIDARQTGFSYNLMENPSSREQRILEFNAQNFNIYTDAADFLRVILEIFHKFPQLEKNRVILVPESFGGFRATVMLHILLNPGLYKSANRSEYFVDPELVNRIESHYERVFAGNRHPTKMQIAGQFSHQIMIQPGLSWYYQQKATGDEFEKPGSIIHQLALEAGKIYTPCAGAANCNPFFNAINFIRNVLQRDIYYYTQPDGTLFKAFDRGGILVKNLSMLTELISQDPRTIEGFYASARARAYRFGDPDFECPDPDMLFITRRPNYPETNATELKPESDFEYHFGRLFPWDAYFLGSNSRAHWAFYYNITRSTHGNSITPYNYENGSKFLENLVWVPTFITNAALDLLVYSPAVPVTFSRYYQYALQGVEWEPDACCGEERPGRLVFRFRPHFGGNNASSERIVRFPLYSHSSHAVPLNQPAELLADVEAWLRETELLWRDNSLPESGD